MATEGIKVGASSWAARDERAHPSAMVRGSASVATQQPAALAVPHGEEQLWRTATGDEIDLIIDRGGGEVFAVEVKTGSGRDLEAARTLARGAADAGARAACLISQARGVEPLVAGVERRGFASCIDWLPGVKPTHQRRSTARASL
jgi:hypothetical protein